MLKSLILAASAASALCLAAVQACFKAVILQFALVLSQHAVFKNLWDPHAEHAMALRMTFSKKLWLCHAFGNAPPGQLPWSIRKFSPLLLRILMCVTLALKVPRFDQPPACLSFFAC